MNEFQDLCRICLRSEKSMYNLFDSITPVDNNFTSAGVLAVWRTYVKILKDDELVPGGLPNQLCETCRHQILGAYDFAEKFENSKIIFGQLKQVKVCLQKIEIAPKIPEDRNAIVQNSSRSKSMMVLLKRTKATPVSRNKDTKGTVSKEERVQKRIIFESKYCYKNSTHDKPIYRQNKFVFDGMDLDGSDVNLTSPQKENTRQSEIKCEICSKDFSMMISYNRHMRIHSAKNGPLECTICKARFSNESVFKAHSYTHSIKGEKCIISSETLKCEHCAQQFATQRQLASHMSSHVGSSKKYKCEVCTKVYETKARLKLHKRRHEKKHKCHMCSRSFGVRKQLAVHLIQHQGLNPSIKTFRCNVCNEGYANKKALLRHENFHKRVKPYECTQCKKRFSKIGRYNYHMQHHKISYPCPQCDERFFLKRDMNSHVVNMHRPKAGYAFWCDKCDAKFPLLKELQKHSQVHAKDHACEICDKTFSLAYHLKLHMRIHSDQMFDCDLCGESFVDGNELSVHLKIHQEVQEVESQAEETEIPEVAAKELVIVPDVLISSEAPEDPQIDIKPQKKENAEEGPQLDSTRDKSPCNDAETAQTE